MDGAALMRFHGEKALGKRSIEPQQVLVADVLAAGHRRNAILMPRRSTKSTTILAVALGRAAHREDYRVGILTMTSGKAGRARFLKDVAPHLERLYPEASDRPFRIVKSAGQERVEFPNGSFVQWLSSLADVRGEAFDLLILDEAGEADPEHAADALAAALPTMDTRPGAQLVVAGTAGAYRIGNLLWDALELGRSGVGGIVDYSIEDHYGDEELAAWEPSEEHPEARVRDLVLQVHPGVPSMVPLEVVKENFLSLGPRFLPEYLGLFGSEGAGTRLIDLAQWNALALDMDVSTLALPPLFSIAMAAHPKHLHAAICAAWKDEEGVNHVVVLKAGPGTTWVAHEAYRLFKKYLTPIAYNSNAQGLAVEIEKLNQEASRPKLAPIDWAGIRTSASKLVQAVDGGTLRHYNQDELNDAAAVVVRRTSGTAGAWALGRPKDADSADITAIEAAAMALHHLNTLKPKSKMRSFVVT